MESDKAHEALLSISRNKNFNLLSEYLQNSEPIKINLSPLPFVEYLASVVVSQQLSTKAAKTIWSRVQPIIQGNKYSKSIEAALQEAGLSKSKANYVRGLIQNSELSSFKRSDLCGLTKAEFENTITNAMINANIKTNNKYVTTANNIRGSINLFNILITFFFQ